MFKELALRAGYNSGATAGVSILLGDFSLDYAFMFRELQNFQRVGLNYRF